jgi:hypothetical protein
MVELTDRDVDEVAVIGVAKQKKSRDDRGQSRGGRGLAKLRADHLNNEENKLLHEMCIDYQDVFFLPGDKSSCKYEARITIS